MKKIEETAKLLEQARESLQDLSVDLEKLNEEHQTNIVKHFSDLGLKFEELELKDFFKKPYILLPKGKQEWYCIVPSFINFQVGYFDRREGNYNIYIINKYSRWMNDIPDFMLDEIALETPENIYVKDGELRFDENLLDKIRTKFGHRIKDLQKDKAKIKQGHEFELIAELIEDGNLPFIPHPVDKEDQREPQINFKMEGKYSFQEEIYKEFLKKGAVGVYWMTSAGKSFLAMKVLDSLNYDAKEKRKFLVAPTATLVDQWKLYFEQYAPRLLDEVDLLTYQAYHKIAENIKKGNKYICGVFDECLTGDTKILMENGFLKEIRDLKDGEKVYLGGQISNKFKRFSSILNIRTSNGWLKTTPTHPNFVIKKESFERDKHKNQYKPLNEKNVKILKSNELKKGDYLLVPKKIPHKKIFNWTAKQLRFIALIMCDGHIAKKGNMIRVSISKDKGWFKQEFLNGLKAFGFEKMYREKENQRGDLNIWVNSKSLKDLLINTFKIPAGKKSDKIKISKQILYSPLKSIQNFIDVCICCEGHYTERYFISTTSKDFALGLRYLLNLFCVNSKITIEKKRKKNHHSCYRIHFRKYPFNLSLKRKQNKREKYNTHKFERIVKLNGKNYFLSKINEITKLKKRKSVYDFTTEKKCFIANNFLTHNCDRLPADTFSRFSTINMKYRLGLSATPYREDGRTNYIFALTGYPFGLDWGSLIKILEKKLHAINVFILKSEKDKVRKIGELLDVNKKTLIFSDSISLGKEISRKFDVPFIYGSTKKRLEVLEDNKVNVVSRVMDYGISIKDLQHIIEADFLFGSRKQQVQRTGRLLHTLRKDSRHDILFSASEFDKYKKRLFGLMEKGFKLNFFNEASRHRVKIDEEDLRPMSKIKLPDKKEETLLPGIEPGLEPREEIISHSKVDYETFLKNETVQKLIKNAIAESRAPSKYIKGTLALILQMRRAVNYEEIRKSLGLSDASHIGKATTVLEKYDLIKKFKKDNLLFVDFNIKGISEIVELSKQREKSQKLIDELFEEKK